MVVLYLYLLFCGTGLEWQLLDIAYDHLNKIGTKEACVTLLLNLKLFKTVELTKLTTLRLSSLRNFSDNKQYLPKYTRLHIKLCKTSITWARFVWCSRTINGQLILVLHSLICIRVYIINEVKAFLCRMSNAQNCLINETVELSKLTTTDEWVKRWFHIIWWNNSTVRHSKRNT